MSLYTRFFFFFNDTATTEIYTLSLHDALPILLGRRGRERPGRADVEDHDAWPGAELESAAGVEVAQGRVAQDRKSTRLNSSHSQISYAVFCLKKKKKEETHTAHRTVTHVRTG